MSKFRILKIQDGGRISTETLLTQMLQSFARGVDISSQSIGTINLFVEHAGRQSVNANRNCR